MIRNEQLNLTSHTSMHLALVALLAEIEFINHLLSVDGRERNFAIRLICVFLVLNLGSYWANRQRNWSAWLVTP